MPLGHLAPLLRVPTRLGNRLPLPTHSVSQTSLPIPALEPHPTIMRREVHLEVSVSLLDKPRIVRIMISYLFSILIPLQPLVSLPSRLKTQTHSDHLASLHNLPLVILERLEEAGSLVQSLLLPLPPRVDSEDLVSSPADNNRTTRLVAQYSAEASLARTTITTMPVVDCLASPSLVVSSETIMRPIRLAEALDRVR